MYMQQCYLVLAGITNLYLKKVFALIFENRGVAETVFLNMFTIFFCTTAKVTPTTS
jgi:hypothetical protein